MSKTITRKFSTRITFTPHGEGILDTVGSFLSKLRNDDYQYLLRQDALGIEPVRDYRRQHLYMYNLNKRLADAIILANKEQWKLRKRTRTENVKEWEKDITLIDRELKKTTLDKGQRFFLVSRKNDRVRKIRLSEEKGNSVCFGGKKLFQELVENPYNPEVKEDWSKKRLFLNFAGESGRNAGNDIIKINTSTHELWLHLPEELAHELGLEEKSLIGTVNFKHGRKDVYRCIDNKVSVSHEFRWDRVKRQWVLDSTARFAEDEIVRHSPRVSPHRYAGIDFNNGFINATVIDKCANVVAQREFQYQGASSVEKLVLDTMKFLQYHHVSHVYCEKLTGLQRSQTRKRGRAGALNRVVSSLPTGEFARKMSDLTENRGIKLSFINPKNTSKSTSEWAEDCFGVSVHEKASYLIARRGLGLSIHRRIKLVLSSLTSGLVMTNAGLPGSAQALESLPSRGAHDRSKVFDCVVSPG